MKQKLSTKNSWKIDLIYLILVFSEIILISLLFSFFSKTVLGGAGTNVTVVTTLNVVNVAPEVLVVDINGNSNALNLNANTTKVVSCAAIIRDFNNDSYIQNVSGEFYDKTASSYGGLDDNNNHYTNSSCNFSRNFTGPFRGYNDDQYNGLANCTFQVWYYANPTNWNCTIFANDSNSYSSTNSTNITVNELLALAIPPSIDFGTVGSTFLSIENISNVSNGGNVKINFSLEGYAINPHDGLAMNCSLGSIKNISIQHEKYNLTASNPAANTLALASQVYTNMSTIAVIKTFQLDYRRQDSYNDASNATYWRIYAPLGVAGSCQGNIIFGATKAPGS